MQLKTQQLLIATTIIATLLALSPSRPLLTTVIVFLLGGWEFAYFIRKRKQKGVDDLGPPPIEIHALIVLCGFTFFVWLAFVLPIALAIEYAADGWSIDRWFLTQLLCYASTWILLNMSAIEPDRKSEFGITFTIVYIFCIPSLALGMNYWHSFAI